MFYGSLLAVVLAGVMLLVSQPKITGTATYTVVSDSIDSIDIIKVVFKSDATYAIYVNDTVTDDDFLTAYKHMIGNENFDDRFIMSAKGVAEVAFIDGTTNLKLSRNGNLNDMVWVELAADGKSRISQKIRFDEANDDYVYITSEGKTTYMCIKNEPYYAPRGQNSFADGGVDDFGPGFFQAVEPVHVLADDNPYNNTIIRYPDGSTKRVTTK